MAHAIWFDIMGEEISNIFINFFFLIFFFL
jgi:hypothetical protein